MKHQKRFAFVLGLAAMFSLVLPPGANAIYVMERIADSNTDMPGNNVSPTSWQPVTFQSFSVPVVDGLRVAFIGKGWFKYDGVFLHASGTLSPVATTATLFPAATGGIKTFGKLAIDATRVGFTAKHYGVGVPPTQAVYISANNNISVLADTSTPVPAGSGNFTRFDDVDLDAGFSSFIGYREDPLAAWDGGIYTDVYGPLSVVADLHATVPGTSYKFAAFGRLAQSGTDTGFLGAASGATFYSPGIYTHVTGVTRIADYNTPIPGASGKFAGLDLLDVSGGKIAFIAEQGIYGASVIGGPINSIVGPGNAPTDAKIFDSLALSGERLAFVARPSLQLVAPALYLHKNSDNSFTRLLKAGDKLDGRKVGWIHLNAKGIDGPYLAFHAMFTDGTEGVYRAIDSNLLSGTVTVGHSQVNPISCDLQACGPRQGFSFTLSGAGLGVDIPVWIGAMPVSSGHELAADGSRFASVTPPSSLDPDRQSLFDLWLRDESGETFNTGFQIAGGERFSFLSDNPDFTTLYGDSGMTRFGLRASSDPGGECAPSSDINCSPGALLANVVDAEPFAVGLTFVDPGATVDIQVQPETILGVEVRMKPRTLNLHARGRVVKALVELPDGVNPDDIDPKQTWLQPGLPDTSPIPVLRIGRSRDKDGDGQWELALRFSRPMLRDRLQEMTDNSVELTVSGMLLDGRVFEGSDVIRVKRRGRQNSHASFRSRGAASLSRHEKEEQKLKRH